MTVATCEMKEEDTKSQVLFWKMLNSVMTQNGFPEADFFGFMADEASANWLAVRTVFNGGPENIMEGRERTCLFHWKQSLHIHTKKHVKECSRQEHIELCEKWRLCTHINDASNQSRQIRQWWRNGNVYESSLPSLDIWLSWWEVRIAHWGSVMSSVSLYNFPYQSLSF